MALDTSRMLFRLSQEKDLKERHICQASLREGQSVMKTEDPAQDQNRPAEKGT